MHDRDGSKPPLSPGDWVEWCPPRGKWTRVLGEYAGRMAIVYQVGRGKATVRFTDLTFQTVSASHLTWMPSRSETRLAVAVAKAQQLEWLRNSGGEHPTREQHGNPHTFSDGPRRAGSTPGGKD